MYLNARITIACLLVLGVARAATADLPEAVRRHVDDSTIAVGRIDLSGLDSKALLDFATGLMTDVPAAQRDRSLAELRETLGQFDQTTGSLRQSGVTKAWFIVSGDSLMRRESPLVIVPVESDQQAKIVTDFLTERAREHQRIEGAVLIGSKSAITAAQAIGPAERPTFAANLQDDGPAVQVVLEPTATIRMAGEQAMQQLAQRSPEVSAQAVALVQALKTIKLTLDLPPRPQGQVVFDFADAASAQQAQALLAQGVGAARQAIENRQAAGERVTPAMTQQIAAALAPKVEGASVVVDIDERELRETVGGPLVVALMAGRERAAQVRAGSNLRLIAGTMRQELMKDQQGTYPADLEALMAMVRNQVPPEEGEQAIKELFTNPQTGAFPGFAYVRAVENEKQLKDDLWRTLVIAYGKPPAKAEATYQVNVLYVDGHVEMMPLSKLETIAKEQGFTIERLPEN